jgi:exopolysaccharide biosynthesis polyprenyl glycosylphosphotransferase
MEPDSRHGGTMKNTKVPVRWRLKPGERRIILLLGDLAAAYAALIISLYIWARGDAWLTFSLEFLKQRPALWYWLLPILWLLMLVELYDVRRSSRRSETLRGVVTAAVVSGILYSLVYFTSSRNSLPRIGVAVFIIATTVLTILWRLIYISVFTAPTFMRRVLILGAGKAGTTLVNVVKDTWPPPFHLVGLIDDDIHKAEMKIEDYPVLGDNSQLLRIIKDEKISDLVLAISGEMNSSMFQAILDAEEQDVEVTTMPMVYEETLGRVPIFLLEADWIIRSFVDQSHTNAFYEIAKRLMDILGGLIGTLIFVVVFPFIGLAIILETGFPIIFMQNRLGKNGRTYRIIKFRTMNQDAEKDGQPQVTKENDARITKVGWFLRKTHLDEWPNFINVLRGEMSLVGPRAERSELVENLQAKIPFYRARLLVKPGATGWAQVNFGYAATVEDTAIKLEYDLYYIKHRNLLFDIEILLRTFGTMIGFRGQ